MARYQTEIVWNCKCGESGTIPLSQPDDDAGRLLLLRNTHRSERGCDLQATVSKREQTQR